jgi:hypothetical protein
MKDRPGQRSRQRRSAGPWMTLLGGLLLMFSWIADHGCVRNVEDRIALQKYTDLQETLFDIDVGQSVPVFYREWDAGIRDTTYALNLAVRGAGGLAGLTLMKRARLAGKNPRVYEVALFERAAVDTAIERIRASRDVRAAFSLVRNLDDRLQELAPRSKPIIRAEFGLALNNVQHLGTIVFWTYLAGAVLTMVGVFLTEHRSVD